jgi:hypothetical protein
VPGDGSTQLLHRFYDGQLFLSLTVRQLHKDDRDQDYDDSYRLQGAHYLPQDYGGDGNREHWFQAAGNHGAGGIKMLQTGKIEREWEQDRGDRE